jgi:hypothetical protein
MQKILQFLTSSHQKGNAKKHYAFRLLSKILNLLPVYKYYHYYVKEL